MSVEGRIARNPEALQRSLSNSITRGGDGFETLLRIRHDHAMGGQITPDTREYIDATGFTGKQVALITDSLGTERATAMKQYLTFLGGKGDEKTFRTLLQVTMESFKQVSQDEWAKKGFNLYDLAGYFEYLIALNPLMGISTILLYKQSLDQDRKDDTSEKGVMFGWFKNTVEKAVKTDKTVGSFFETVRSEGTGNESELTHFLSDWEKEIQLNIAECLNLASCMAIHIQNEDCAVLTSSLLVPLGGYDFRQAVQAVNDLAGHSVYKEYLGDISQWKQEPQNGVRIPAYTSVIDVKRAIEAYERFWGRALDGINAKDLKLQKHDDAVSLLLGNAATVFVRPRENPRAEARIDIQGGQPYSGLSIRVDNERGRNRISADMGGAAFQDAIDYARHVARLSTNKNIVMNYKQMIDERGRLIGNDKIAYPSIMEFDSIDVGKKIALFLALAMQEGNAVGFRSGDFYLHHSREYVAKPEYYEHFATIAEQFVSVYRRIQKKHSS